MALLLENFQPIGFASAPAGQKLAVDTNGRVSAVASPDARRIDCNGAFLSPGWADLHVHVWHGGTDISVRAGDIGAKRGVTAMADAGSAGEATFHGLREYVIDQHRETIKAFLNIGSIGLVACNRVSELIDERSIDIERTLDVVERNRDVICGIKIRACRVVLGAWGITPVRIAKNVAEIVGLPLMVHIGEPAPTLDEVFSLLTPGDVVTHCYNGKRPGAITDTPKLFESAQRLAETGVLMDVGHGAASYNFDVAKSAIGAGMKPYSISTDLHLHNIDGPVHDLSTTVAKLFAAGLSFEDCVDGIAGNPRRFLNIPSGTKVGDRADYTIFDLADCDEIVADSQGNELNITKSFDPRFSILGSDVIQAGRKQPVGGN
jgi:dihydroorotase